MQKKINTKQMKKLKMKQSNERKGWNCDNMHRQDAKNDKGKCKTSKIPVRCMGAGIHMPQSTQYAPGTSDLFERKHNELINKDCLF